MEFNEKIRNKVNKIKENKKLIILLPFILIFLFSAFRVFKVQMSNDDLVFVRLMKESTIKEQTIERYKEWSSRNFLEAVMFLIFKMPHALIVWKILFCLINVLILYSIYYLLIKDVKSFRTKIMLLMIATFSTFFVSRSSLSDAGWMATTFNYLFVLAFGLYTLVGLKKINDHEKISWIEKLSYVFACLFASNQEQMVVVLILAFGTYFIYKLIMKKFNLKEELFAIVLFVLEIASIIFILTCPGNNVRGETEIYKWFPDYAEFGLFSKVQLSFTSLFHYMIFKPNIPLIGLSIILMYLTFKNKKNICLKTLSIYNLIILTMMNIFSGMTAHLFPTLFNLFQKYNVKGLVIVNENLKEISIYVPMILFLFLIISIAIMLYTNLKKENKYIAILVLGIGLISRLIMGFSPTVYASGERTCLFMYYAFICMYIIGCKNVDEEVTQNATILTTLSGLFNCL